MDLRTYVKNSIEQNKYDSRMEGKIDKISLDLIEYKNEHKILHEELNVDIKEIKKYIAKSEPILDVFNTRIITDKEFKRRAKVFLFWLSIVAGLATVYYFGKTLIKDIISHLK